MIRHRHSVSTRHRSIFLRLLFVLLATMGLIHLLLGGAFGFLAGSVSKPYIRSNIQHYAEFIAKEIGSPPDTVKARALAERYMLYIGYQGKEFDWSSYTDMPKPSRGIGPSSLWRQPFVIENPDGSRVVLIWRFGPKSDMFRSIFIGLLLVITLIFAGTHASIRRVLRPIRWLKKAVDDIGAGNLDVSVPVTRNDELGRLAEAFNGMVQRIKSMLSARDQLLLDVSHELRSPLTRIRIALEFLEDNEKKQGILSDINEIETMLAEILETERLSNQHGRIQLSETDLVELVNETSGLFEGKKPGFDLSGMPEKCLLPLDPERIRIVLKNLIDNALKFSCPESGPVQIRLIKQNGEILLEIIDDGTGVPESQIPYLFEPFFRADKSRAKMIKGYGLGLHLCRKIMEAHHGDISLRNNPGRGVTVTVSFIM